MSDTPGASSVGEGPSTGQGQPTAEGAVPTTDGSHAEPGGQTGAAVPPPQELPNIDPNDPNALRDLAAGETAEEAALRNREEGVSPPEPRPAKGNLEGAAEDTSKGPRTQKDVDDYLARTAPKPTADNTDEADQAALQAREDNASPPEERPAAGNLQGAAEDIGDTPSAAQQPINADSSLGAEQSFKIPVTPLDKGPQKIPVNVLSPATTPEAQAPQPAPDQQAASQAEAEENEQARRTAEDDAKRIERTAAEDRARESRTAGDDAERMRRQREAIVPDHTPNETPTPVEASAPAQPTSGEPVQPPAETPTPPSVEPGRTPADVFTSRYFDPTRTEALYLEGDGGRIQVGANEDSDGGIVYTITGEDNKPVRITAKRLNERLNSGELRVVEVPFATAELPTDGSAAAVAPETPTPAEPTPSAEVGTETPNNDLHEAPVAPPPLDLGALGGLPLSEHWQQVPPDFIPPPGVSLARDGVSPNLYARIGPPAGPEETMQPVDLAAETPTGTSDGNSPEPAATPSAAEATQTEEPPTPPEPVADEKLQPGFLARVGNRAKSLIGRNQPAKQAPWDLGQATGTSGYIDPTAGVTPSAETYAAVANQAIAEAQEKTYPENTPEFTDHYPGAPASIPEAPIPTPELGDFLPARKTADEAVEASQPVADTSAEIAGKPGKSGVEPWPIAPQKPNERRPYVGVTHDPDADEVKLPHPTDAQIRTHLGLPPEEPSIPAPPIDRLASEQPVEAPTTPKTPRQRAALTRRINTLERQLRQKQDEWNALLKQRSWDADKYRAIEKQLVELKATHDALLAERTASKTQQPVEKPIAGEAAAEAKLATGEPRLTPDLTSEQSARAAQSQDQEAPRPQEGPSRADYESAIRQIEETGSANDPETGEPIVAISREHAIRNLRRRMDELPAEAVLPTQQASAEEASSTDNAPAPSQGTGEERPQAGDKEKPSIWTPIPQRDRTPQTGPGRGTASAAPAPERQSAPVATNGLGAELPTVPAPAEPPASPPQGTQAPGVGPEQPPPSPTGAEETINLFSNAYPRYEDENGSFSYEEFQAKFPRFIRTAEALVAQAKVMNPINDDESYEAYDQRILTEVGNRIKYYSAFSGRPADQQDLLFQTIRQTREYEEADKLLQAVEFLQLRQELEANNELTAELHRREIHPEVSLTGVKDLGGGYDRVFNDKRGGELPNMKELSQADLYAITLVADRLMDVVDPSLQTEGQETKTYRQLLREQEGTMRDINASPSARAQARLRFNSIREDFYEMAINAIRHVNVPPSTRGNTSRGIVQQEMQKVLVRVRRMTVDQLIDEYAGVLVSQKTHNPVGLLPKTADKMRALLSQEKYGDVLLDLALEGVDLMSRRNMPIETFDKTRLRISYKKLVKIAPSKVGGGGTGSSGGSSGGGQGESLNVDQKVSGKQEGEEATPPPAEEPETPPPSKEDKAEEPPPAKEFRAQFSVVDQSPDINVRSALGTADFLRQEQRKGSRLNPLNWSRKIGLTLVEKHVTRRLEKKLREAMRDSDNSSLGFDLVGSTLRARNFFRTKNVTFTPGNTQKARAEQAATIEDIRENKEEGLVRRGQKVEVVQGALRQEIMDKIIKPIIDGTITDTQAGRLKVQQLLTDFVKAHPNDPQVVVMFGTDQSDIGALADYFATDFFESAKAANELIKAEKYSLEKLDKEAEITFGRTTWAAETKLVLSPANRLVVLSRRLGAERTNATMASVAASLLTYVVLRQARASAQTMAAVPIVGLVFGAALAGRKRYNDITTDSAFNAAESTLGRSAPLEKPGVVARTVAKALRRSPPQPAIAPRREALNRYALSRVTDTEIMDGAGARKGLRKLSADLRQNPTDVALRDELLREAVDADARLDYSNENRVDLVTYSSDTDIQASRQAINRLLREAKNAIASTGLTPEQIQTKWDELKREKKKDFDADKKTKDKDFGGYRRRQVATAALIGGVTGAATGVAGVEVAHKISDVLSGTEIPADISKLKEFIGNLLPGKIKETTDHSVVFEGPISDDVRQQVEAQGVGIKQIEPTPHTFGQEMPLVKDETLGREVQIPEGTKWIPNSVDPSTWDLVSKANPQTVLISKADFDTRGMLNFDEAHSVLKQDAVVTGRQIVVPGEPTATKTVQVRGANGYWAQHAAHFDDEWYRNDTTGHYEGNELKLRTFKDGAKLRISMGGMLQSTQAGLSPNPAHVDQLIRSGKAGIAFTVWDVQNGHNVFQQIFVPVDTHGDLILDPTDNNPAHVFKINGGKGTVQAGEFARTVLDEKALAKLPDGQVVTERAGHMHRDIFTIMGDRHGLVRAGRLVDTVGPRDRLQIFATLVGEGKLPSRVSVGGTGPSTLGLANEIHMTRETTVMAPTFEASPLASAGKGSDIPMIPVSFGPRFPLEPLGKDGEKAAEKQTPESQQLSSELEQKAEEIGQKIKIDSSKPLIVEDLPILVDEEDLFGSGDKVTLAGRALASFYYTLSEEDLSSAVEPDDNQVRMYQEITGSSKKPDYAGLVAAMATPVFFDRLATEHTDKKNSGRAANYRAEAGKVRAIIAKYEVAPKPQTPNAPAPASSQTTPTTAASQAETDAEQSRTDTAQDTVDSRARTAEDDEKKRRQNEALPTNSTSTVGPEDTSEPEPALPKAA